jgi:hypothetical protein
VADGVLLDTVTDPDVVRRAREAVGDAHVAAYTPVEPGLARQSVLDWVAELHSAGADSVILQGTDEQPGAAPLIAALAG